MQETLCDIMTRTEPYTAEEIEQLQQKEEWHHLMTDMITQMMFVSGETGEPSVETTTIIEEIVREQVVEMVSCKACRSLSFHNIAPPRSKAPYLLLAIFPCQVLHVLPTLPNPFKLAIH